MLFVLCMPACLPACLHAGFPIRQEASLQSVCHCRRRKRSAAAISKQQSVTPPQAKLAGPSVATGCKAAASIAALTMQDASSDAWLRTLCNQRQASDDLTMAQPLDASFRHSSGGSDQSLSNRTSFSKLSSPLHANEHSSLPLYEQPAVYTAAADTTGSIPQESAPAQQQLPCAVWPASAVAASQDLDTVPADDPLQDVLSWQLPPLEDDSKPSSSSFDQALAFMQAGSSYPQPAPAVVYPPHQQWQQQQQQLQQQQQIQQAHNLLQPQSVMAGLGSHAAVPMFSTSSCVQDQVPCKSYSSLGASAYPSMPVGLQQQQQQQWQHLQQPYTTSNVAVRMSIKLFNCTPAQLPSGLRDSVTGWLGSTPANVEGYIRPGCVHLTLQAVVPAISHSQLPSQGQSGPQNQPPMLSETAPQPEQLPSACPADMSVKHVVGHLLASDKGDIWHNCTMLVQLGSEAAVVHQGKPLKVWNIQMPADSPQAQQKHEAAESSNAEQAACCALPDIHSKLPMLSLAQPACLIAATDQQQTVTIVAEDLSSECKLLCRAGGRHVDVHMSQINATGSTSTLQVCYPILLLSMCVDLLADPAPSVTQVLYDMC